MGRFQAYGQTDNQWQLDGDPSFRGLDMLHDRSTLQPGYLARSQNKRLRDGPAKTRLGTSMPGDFNPGFTGAIVGSLIYNNPNGAEVMLVATTGADYVWALQFGNDPIQIPLEAPETIGNKTVEFVQAFDKVLMMRRPNVLPPSPNYIATVEFTTGASGDITAGSVALPKPHHLLVNAPVRFATDDTLPASINPTTQYYVKTVVSLTVFHVAATVGGALITFVTAGSGTHKVRYGLDPAAVPMLQWEGSFSGPNFKFQPINLDPPGEHLVPVAYNAEPHQNHLIYYNALLARLPWRDQILVSDSLNYTSFDDPLGVFRINAGESNMITRVMSYFRASLVIFMKQSIHMLSNFTLIDALGFPDIAAANQRMLSTLGSVGNKMPLQDGSDVIFLSQPDGFYRLGEVIQDQITVQPVPISRNIQPIIDRIDWNRANVWACSEGLGDYAYFALPLRGTAGANNCLAVYNRITREWESIDSWAFPNFRISRLHTTLYDGARSLFAIGNTGPTYNVYMLNNGLSDQVGGRSMPVRDLIETRGYTLRDSSAFKRIERAVIGLQTFQPQVKITAINDGVNEEKRLSVIVKDWRRSYVHGRGEFIPGLDPENTPRREDYAAIVGITDFAGEDFEDYEVGPVTFIAEAATVYTGIKQETIERFQVRQNARWISIRVEGVQGQCDVLSVGVEGYNTQETIKPIA